MESSDTFFEVVYKLYTTVLNTNLKNKNGRKLLESRKKGGRGGVKPEKQIFVSKEKLFLHSTPSRTVYVQKKNKNITPLMNCRNISLTP